MKEIGLVGGTFDPIHIGHLLLGQWAMEEFRLDEIWFIPAGMPYFKSGTGVTQAKKRLRMTELAVEGMERGKVSNIEIEIGSDRNTYTYETVERLNEEYPDVHFSFIFGADCLEALENWKYPERILKGCDIIAATRGDITDTKAMEKKAEALTVRYGGRIRILKFPAMGISSTMVRERVKEGKSIRHLVPESVEGYIKKEGLYL